MRYFIAIGLVRESPWPLNIIFARSPDGRSCFESDFFKQLRESRVGTQVIQTRTDGVFSNEHNAEGFVFYALCKASKGFVMIA